ncbi:MAG: pilus assembly protein [Cellulomonas sp.]|jgi:hypothetical protein|nr:pilus assembly protein [Cellulomonas sp.]
MVLTGRLEAGGDEVLVFSASRVGRGAVFPGRGLVSGHRCADIRERPTSERGASWSGVLHGRAQRYDEGSAAIEAAILFPFVLLLVITVFQASVCFHARNVALSAANGGAAIGAVEDGSAAEAEVRALP